jgi:nucleoside-diphosphate-sugar epimerase
VTGSDGFIGRILCPVLAASGHKVAALDRTALGDITRVSDWPMRLAGVQAVVHLAALAHARGVEPDRLRQVNVQAAVALGRAAAAEGVRMLFLSSVKVHGEASEAQPFSEASPIAPQDDYARAKAAAEAALRSVPGLALTVLRPPLVYGPGVKANFLALLRALAAGWPLPLAAIDNRRSLIYAGNLADAALRCLESPAAAGKDYVLSDGSAISTPELCRRLAAALGRRPRLFPLPRGLLELAPPARRLTRSLRVDDSAIRRDLGWTARYSLDEGLRRTAAWFLDSHG